MAITFIILTFFSTLAGGLIGLRFRDKMHLMLGFTAGVLVSVVAFDIFPELFDLVAKTGTSIRWPMVALIAGFLVFHIA